MQAWNREKKRLYDVGLHLPSQGTDEKPAAAVEFSGYQLQNWLKYVVKTGKQNEAKIV